MSGHTVKTMVPVVVVGGSLNALGVVRSLARGGMPIFLVVTTRWHTAAWSRFCHVVKIPSVKGHGLVDGLRELSTSIGKPAVLILTEDRDVEVVSTFRTELEHRFHLSLPPEEMITTLADKTLFQKFAEKEGFPVPRAIVLRGVEELPLLQILAPPLVIGGGKDGYLYVLNRDSMGGLGDTNAWQRFNFGNGIFATGAFWNSNCSMTGQSGKLQAFSLNSTTAKMNTPAYSVSGFGSVSASAGTVLDW
jgi:hypothetical protein